MSKKYRFSPSPLFWQDSRRVALGLFVFWVMVILGFGTTHVVMEWHNRQQRDRDRLLLNRAITQRWDGNYQRCIDELTTLSPQSDFYTSAQDLLYVCQDLLAQHNIAQAETLAENGEFKAALLTLAPIPDGFYATEVQRLTENWSKRILEIAESYFLTGDLSKAIATANSLPEANPLRAVALEQIQTWQALWATNQSHHQSAEIALKMNDLETALFEINQINYDRYPYWTTRVNALLEAISQKQQAFAAVMTQAEQAKLQGNCQAATQRASELPDTHPWSEKKAELLADIADNCGKPAQSNGPWAEVIAGILIVLGELLTWAGGHRIR